MHQQLPAHHAVTVVGVARPGDPCRISLHRPAARDGLPKALPQALTENRLARATCVSPDRGDGALLLVPPNVPETRSATSFPAVLVAPASRHNAGRAGQKRMRSRAALPAAGIHRDPRGAAGAAVNHASRSLQAPALRSAFGASSGVLAVIVPGWPVSQIGRHDPAAQASPVSPARGAQSALGASRPERYPVPAKAVQPGRPQ